MSKKKGERLPQNSGEGTLMKNYYAIKSPWERLIGYRDAMHYSNRFEQLIGAAALEAYRIMIPDYEERAQLMCEDAFARLLATNRMYGMNGDDLNNIQPYMCGQFVGGLIGDQGDDALLMCGRVQDFGTYRCEKELDVCDWDIVGTELCRATTMSLQACAVGCSERHFHGPTMEYSMYEAKGAGDRHCRIVAENRDKYPMPERKLWQSFGPIATADMIKYTEEEDCVKEAMVFREECNYRFGNGTDSDLDSSSANMVSMSTSASLYILPAIEAAIRTGKVTEEMAYHILRCTLRTTGKGMFIEKYAVKGCRDWMAVPNEISDDDGRVMGALIEMQLQAVLCNYEIEAFNEKECIYVIDRAGLEITGAKKLPEAHLWLWEGCVKTLVNAQWMVWEEDSPEGKLRIKIAKKIDKFQ